MAASDAVQGLDEWEVEKMVHETSTQDVRLITLLRVEMCAVV